MANRLTQEKANRIAANYMSNGNLIVKALIDTGYKKSYADKMSNKILDNVLVKNAISQLRANLELKTGLTIEKCQKEHEQMQQLCLAKGDRTNATANLIAKYKTIAAYKDKAIVDTNVVINVVNYKPNKS
jgi:hypothetical protein